MTLWRVLTRQLCRGISAEHSSTAQSYIHTSILTDSMLALRSNLQTATRGANCQRAIHNLHEAFPLHVSSTAQGSAAAARRSLMQSSRSHVPHLHRALRLQHTHSSARCFSNAPALVRRWQLGAALEQSRRCSSFGSSTVRGFASQAQRSQQRRQLQKKSSEQGVYLIALVVGMVGLTYASVPLYRCAAVCMPGLPTGLSASYPSLRTPQIICI